MPSRRIEFPDRIDVQALAELIKRDFGTQAKFSTRTGVPKATISEILRYQTVPTPAFVSAVEAKGIRLPRQFVEVEETRVEREARIGELFRQRIVADAVAAAQQQGKPKGKAASQDTRPIMYCSVVHAASLNYNIEMLLEALDLVDPARTRVRWPFAELRIVYPAPSASPVAGGDRFAPQWDLKNPASRLRRNIESIALALREREADLPVRIRPRDNRVNYTGWLYDDLMLYNTYMHHSLPDSVYMQWQESRLLRRHSEDGDQAQVFKTCAEHMGINDPSWSRAPKVG